MIRIELARCAACGALETISDAVHKNGSRTVTVGCGCGSAGTATYDIAAGEQLTIVVPVKMTGAADGMHRADETDGDETA